jgi:hypothetical protein
MKAKKSEALNPKSETNPNDRNLKLETDGEGRMNEGQQNTEKRRKEEKISRKIEKNRGF